MTESEKSGLIRTSNYTNLVSHNFPCELPNNTTFASFLFLCLIYPQDELCTYVSIIEYADIYVRPVFVSSVTN